MELHPQARFRLCQSTSGNRWAYSRRWRGSITRKGNGWVRYLAGWPKQLRHPRLPGWSLAHDVRGAQLGGWCRCQGENGLDWLYGVHTGPAALCWYSRPENHAAKSPNGALEQKCETTGRMDFRRLPRRGHGPCMAIWSRCWLDVSWRGRRNLWTGSGDPRRKNWRVAAGRDCLL